MKYKLIKRLPFLNCPQIGYISTAKDEKDNHYLGGMWFQPSQESEFWEKVVEKDYQILEVSLRKPDKHYIRKVDSEDSNDYIQSLINCDGNLIHSIKRLSDSEVFTVGDSLNIEFNTRIVKLKISEIKLYNNELLFDSKSGRGLESFHNYGLKSLIKSKEKLFITEDGVDIFEGDKSYGVRKLDYKIIMIKHIDKTYVSNNFIEFSTKEKAEEYVILNKPCLSIKDVMSIDYDNRGLQSLTQLVKQKLK